MGKDLSNCTVGVIGTGKIGHTVIAHLQGFGCKILAYDLYQSDEVGQWPSMSRWTSCTPAATSSPAHNATAENHHLINAESLAKMKDGVLIVNTARGALIDEEALIAALKERQGRRRRAGCGRGGERPRLLQPRRRCAARPHDEHLAQYAQRHRQSPHNAFYTDVNVASMVRSGFEELTDFAAGRSNPCEVPL